MLVTTSPIKWTADGTTRGKRRFCAFIRTARSLKIILTIAARNPLIYVRTGLTLVATVPRTDEIPGRGTAKKVQRPRRVAETCVLRRDIRLLGLVTTLPVAKRWIGPTNYRPETRAKE